MTAFDVASSIGRGGWFLFMMNRNCAGHAAGTEITNAASRAHRNKRPRSSGPLLREMSSWIRAASTGAYRPAGCFPFGRTLASRQCHAQTRRFMSSTEDNGRQRKSRPIERDSAFGTVSAARRSPPVRGRSQAELSLERAREVALIGKAGQQSHVGQRRITLSQRAARQRNPLTANELANRTAEMAAEGTGEVDRENACLGGHVGKATR